VRYAQYTCNCLKFPENNSAPSSRKIYTTLKIGPLGSTESSWQLPLPICNTPSERSRYALRNGNLNWWTVIITVTIRYIGTNRLLDRLSLFNIPHVTNTNSYHSVNIHCTNMADCAISFIPPPLNLLHRSCIQTFRSACSDHTKWHRISKTFSLL
jgi:hypothetical protein